MPVNDIQVLCQLCVWRFKSNGKCNEWAPIINKIQIDIKQKG